MKAFADFLFEWIVDPIFNQVVGFFFFMIFIMIVVVLIWLLLVAPLALAVNFDSPYLLLLYLVSIWVFGVLEKINF